MIENLGHKTIVMTKYFICSIIFLALFTGMSTTSSASRTNVISATVSDQKNSSQIEPVKNRAEVPVKGIPVNAGSHAPVEKGHGHTPAIDETPHIHHYHKNRVKKLKRHHGKAWFLGQALVIFCNLVLLLIAYLHAAH